jgi:uncharacterized protein with beta-barrel porin domain
VKSYGVRLEGGYRVAVSVYHGVVGITPHAALQAQAFHTPSYSETDLTGGGFGLSYKAMSGTDARSELGSRFDEPTVLGTLPLVLRAKLAQAHDWVSDPALNASFEALPGNGAPTAKNSALTSAGAQLFLTTERVADRRIRRRIPARRPPPAPARCGIRGEQRRVGSARRCRMLCPSRPL